MREAVEKRDGHFGVAENGRLLAKAEVCCDDDGSLGQAYKRALNTPSTRAIMLNGKMACLALMNRKTRRRSCRSRAQTRPPLARECHAPRRAARSRAAADSTHR